VNLKKTLPAIVLTLALMATMGIAVAGNGRGSTDASSASASAKKFSLPAHAIEVSPGVFYLGKAKDKGKVVEGYAFISKDGRTSKARKAKPVDSCYTFLAKDAKWKTVEPYIVDSANIDGLDGSFIAGNLATDIGKWETATGGFDILGDEDSGTVDRDNIGSLNGANEVMFANIDSPGAIGVTIIWGTFSAPKPFRELVEWDMVFDDTDFDWSEDCENDNCTNKMDFENIATHELGHAVGMGDLYTDACNTQTMYGYSWHGDIEKRTLESGDIEGINILY